MAVDFISMYLRLISKSSAGPLCALKQEIFLFQETANRRARSSSCTLLSVEDLWFLSSELLQCINGLTRQAINLLLLHEAK